MSLHEPANIALLDEEFRPIREAQIEAAALLASGDIEAGLEAFVESVGGDWSLTPEPFKAIFRQNAPAVVGTKLWEDPAASLPVPVGLEEFPHPVQFTKGDRSPRFFHVSVDRVAAMMPGAEIVTIPGSHAAMLESPAEYAATLTEFFERAHAGAR